MEILSIIVALLSTISGILGIIVLEKFFGNRLRELFEDTHYLIIFLLVAGYILYALGETTFYLTQIFSAKTTQIGIQDLYWSIGGILLTISFFSIAHKLSKNQDKTKLYSLYFISVITTLIFVYYISLPATSFFDYFYPFLSAISFIYAASIFLFLHTNEELQTPLEIWVIASFFFLIGDLFFGINPLGQTEELALIIADIAYIAGYTASCFAFIDLYKHLHSLQSKE